MHRTALWTCWQITVARHCTKHDAGIFLFDLILASPSSYLANRIVFNRFSVFQLFYPTDPASGASPSSIRSTTVVGVRHNGKVVLGSDGQATMGDTIMKHRAQKVRELYGGKILAGFAGATADAFTLFERFEEKLEQYGGNVTRSAVELAKDWRTDRYLRRLEALLAVASPDRLLLISGTGDVIEPDDEILAIGSGGPYALAAARAMMKHSPEMTPRAIVEEALHIAADICIYSNHEVTLLEIDAS